jgi:hypothetical protein
MLWVPSLGNFYSKSNFVAFCYQRVYRVCCVREWRHAALSAHRYQRNSTTITTRASDDRATESLSPSPKRLTVKTFSSSRWFFASLGRCREQEAFRPLHSPCLRVCVCVCEWICSTFVHSMIFKSQHMVDTFDLGLFNRSDIVGAIIGD